MMNMRKILLPAVTILTPAAVAAQAISPPLPPVERSYDFVWSNQVPFRRAESANLNGDVMPDAIVHAGTQVVGYPNPGALDSANLIPITANDVVPVAGSGLFGRDSLLVVNSAGLHELWLEEQLGGPELDWESSTVTGVLWDNVVRMISDDLGGFAETDLLGLDGTNNQTFHALVRDPADNWAYFPSFTVSHAVVDRQFELIDVDGDGYQDIACLTNAGLKVYKYDGTLQWASANTAPGGRLTTFMDGGAKHLAWVRPTTSGGKALVVFDADGTSEAPVALPSRNYISIDAGDIDNDGDDDLYLADDGTAEGIVLFAGGGTTTTFHFDTNDPDATETFDYASVANTGNIADPLVRDFDGDGYADVFMPVEADTLVHYKSGGDISESGPPQTPLTGAELVEIGIGSFELRVSFDTSWVSSEHDALAVWYVGENVNPHTWREEWTCSASLDSSGTTSLDLELEPNFDPNSDSDILYQAWVLPTTFAPSGPPNVSATYASFERVSQYRYVTGPSCLTYPGEFDCSTDGEEIGASTASYSGTVGVFTAEPRITLPPGWTAFDPASDCGI